MQDQIPGQPAEQSSIGGIVGTVIIIAIIILGGLYFWGKRIEESKAAREMTTDTTSAETNVSASSSIESVSYSDDLDSIDSDLDNTNVDGLGQEMQSDPQ
jgi:FtsZ-interacting cell division protein ZipA